MYFAFCAGWGTVIRIDFLSSTENKWDRQGVIFFWTGGQLVVGGQIRLSDRVSARK